MNCKPGDVAIIISESPKNPGTAGLIVEVISRAPLGDYRLPDGKLATCSFADSWVVKFQRPFPVRHLSGAVRPAKYSSCPDAKLRPIRAPGEDAQDEMLRPLPQQSPAWEIA